MKVWLRIYYIVEMESCGMGRIYTALYRTFREMGLNVVLKNPNERCIEICIGGPWQPSKIDSYDFNNILIGFTTGETNPRVMPYYELFDCFAVNSQYWLDRHPIDKPISIWHLGIEPIFFPYLDRNNDVFTFSHIGIAQYRKGTHLVCMAFDREFQNDNIRLNIISSGITEFYMALKQQFQDNQKIKFIDGYLKLKDMKNRYTGDCLVFPSIREGWGLHLTEAMATGMPAIVSNLPVLHEQFNEDFGWFINTDTDFEFIGGNLPDVYDLQRKMRYVYEHQDEAKQKGINASQNAHQYLTWEYGIKNGLFPILEQYGIKIENIMI